MLHKASKKMTMIVSVSTMLLLTPLVWAQTHDHTEHTQAQVSAQTDEKSLPLEQIHAKTLPSALSMLASLQKAIESGNQKEALTHLNHIKQALMLIQVALAEHVGPTYANTACPIMGGPINLENVTADLTREFNGKKVAFCCAGCPAQWDQLTDAQKKTKLMAVAVKTQAMPMSEMHGQSETGHEGHNH